MYTCKFCNKNWDSSRSFRNHEIRCKSNSDRNPIMLGKGRPIIRPEKFIGPPSPLTCGFCRKLYPLGKSTPAYANHVFRCKLNPDRVIETKTVEGKQKSIDALKKSNLRWKDEDQKLKHSVRMREVAKENPDTYSQKNISRGKKVIIYDGIQFDNSWELDFYKWCHSNNISCLRNKLGFPYEFDGKRTYYPDFFLPEFDVYVEVKGYETDKDLAKWKSFPKKLVKIFKKDIDLIRKNNYNLCVD